MKINKILRRAMRVALVALITLTFISAANPKDSSDKDFELTKNFEILMNLYRDVNLFYVDTTDSGKILEDAAKGMMKNLDPYTTYIPAKDMDDFEIMTTGKYGGMGALIRQKDDYVIISQPYKGFPADKAGLQIGDKILEIDGASAKDYTTEKVSSLLKGVPGTKFELKVEKMLTGEQQTLNITRERIVISGVPYYDMLDGNIGYIVVSDFTEDCANDVRKALMELKKEGDLQGLIIDLRNNGGGILQQAVKILSLFVPKGTEVVSMRGKVKQANEVFRTESDPIEADLPLVVMINGSSASASEIVSGALQDVDRAVLVGERTFGKGLVQNTRPVGYNAYLKVTTAKYYIPSGRCIQAMDYSHRGEDGSVNSVPDSLIQEFTTFAGRKVYDGGGITPDVKVTPGDESSRFSMIIYVKGYIEDFAGEWLRGNPEAVVSDDNFTLDDKIYGQFVEFMKDKDVEFESDTNKSLQELRKNATKEKYIDKIDELLNQVEANLHDDKMANLELYRKELANLIENQIILHKHYQKGVIKKSLIDDKQLEEAKAILLDEAKYNDILTNTSNPIK